MSFLNCQSTVENMVRIANRIRYSDLKCFTAHHDHDYLRTSVAQLTRKGTLRVIGKYKEQGKTYCIF
jgi:hypothetical protein